MKKTIFATCIALAMTIGGLNAADKVGSRSLIIDLNLAYSNYYRAQEALERFQELVDEADKEINDMFQKGVAVAQELDELQGKINSPSTSDDAKKKLTEEANKKAEDLRQREVEINRFRQEKQGQLAERRQSIMNLYLREIGDAAAKIARERGADYVLNASALVYGDPSIDVTEDVVSDLNRNAETPASGKKKKK